jgi:hypothetical protein
MPLVATKGVRDYRAGGNNRVVASAQARSTREIARWYVQRGQFTPIFYDGAGHMKTPSADLLRVRAEVRPGAVLFFSKGRPLVRQGKIPLFTAGAATSLPTL